MKAMPVTLAPSPSPEMGEGSVVSRYRDFPSTVPACHGWLTLTRRGEWRLGDARLGAVERVRHAGMRDFINRHYCFAEDGAWCVENGPQKVYAALEYTPWVFRLVADQLLAHTGAAAGDPDGAWLDEEGSLLLRTSLGIGVLDDRDLPALLDQLGDGAGTKLSDEALEALCTGIGPSGGATLRWGTALLPLEFIAQRDVPTRFGFNPVPQA